MRTHLRVSPELYELIREWSGANRPPPWHPAPSQSGIPVVVDPELPELEWRWEMRCWQCGIAPTGYTELVAWGRRPRVIPVWPAGDHAHSEVPPSPDALLALAEKIMKNIRTIMAE